MSQRRDQARRQRQAALGTVVLSALIVGGIPSPGYAVPTPQITAVPDAGARPVPNGTPALPTGHLSMPKALPSAEIALLEAQVLAVSAETRILEARLSEITQQHTDAVMAQAIADFAWRNASDALAAAKVAAEQAAADAYRAAAVLPPDVPFNSGLRGLDAVLPHPDGLPTVHEAAARELVRAELAEKETFATLTQASELVQALSTEYVALDEQYKQRVKALGVLEKRLADLRSERDRARDAANQQLGSGWDTSQKANNLIAHPKARQAVEFALSQLGKPYLWGAEGPDKYDCSGLIWTAYRRTGVTINRIANDQYESTKSQRVLPSAAYLLPGDLVFFASDPSNPRTIHHVGMYIGNGKMVHSPNSRSTVRVDDLNFASIDFATRVVKALPVPTMSPTPSPTPSATASPTPSATPSPTESPSPSPTPSPSATPSNSPSPTPDEPESPAPETPSPQATTPAAASLEPDPSETPLP